MVFSYFPLLTAGSEASGGNILVLILPIILLFLLMYFMVFRPQANQEKKQKALLATIEIGDSVLTTAGFYGVIIDMIDDQDIIIVEFGNNKNCRIPMKKTSVVEVEKANAQ